MSSHGRFAFGAGGPRRALRGVVIMTAWLCGAILTVPVMGEEVCASTLSSSTVVVPEPATLAYVGVAAAALFRRHRRARCR